MVRPRRPSCSVRSVSAVIFGLERSVLFDQLDFYTLPAIRSGARQGPYAVDDATTTSDNAAGIVLGALDLDTDAPAVTLGFHLDSVIVGNKVMDNQGYEFLRQGCFLPSAGQAVALSVAATRLV